MAMVLLFYTVVLAACAFSVMVGGDCERWGSIIFSTAAVSTSISSWSTTWSRTDWPMAGVDLLCFLALYGLAVRSERYWPIWAAGFQLVAVTTHVAVFLDAPLPHVYRAMETIWGIPAIGAMVIGVIADRRAGLIGAVDDRSAQGSPSTRFRGR